MVTNVKPLVIMGSSRSDGDTRRAVDLALAGIDFDLIDLLQLKIGFYDYHYHNQDDDFKTIIPKMIAADKIIFATPVYWYAMSAPLKIFFDRLSDLVRVKKSEGRALAGKKTFLISCGTDIALPPGYEVPFQSSSEYFDMHYQGSVYLYAGKDEKQRVESENVMTESFQRILNCLD